jgi:predicted nucleic acid-binding protein
VILVDTSIWIDHLDHGDPTMRQLLDKKEVLIHPFVVGEIALGTLRERDRAMREFGKLPFTYPLDDNDVIEMIVAHRLHGVGIGYVDAHLLASCLVNRRTWLWTRDRRLANLAALLGRDATTA